MNNNENQNNQINIEQVIKKDNLSNGFKNKKLLIIMGIIPLIIIVLIIGFKLKEKKEYKEYILAERVYEKINLGDSYYNINNDSNFGYFYTHGKVTINDLTDEILIELTLKKLSYYRKEDFQITKDNLNKEVLKMFNKNVNSYPDINVNNFLCKENDNYYECLKYDEGDGLISKYEKNMLDYEINKYEIIIYERAYYYESTLDEEDYNYSNVMFYDNDKDKNVLLKVKEKNGDFSSLRSEDEIINNKNLIYKWTYKKINDEYYFQSVERDKNYERYE